MSANSAFGGKAGDINNSGVTDLADAIISLQVSADVEPEGVVYKEYEISGDKKVGLEEAIYALRKIADAGELKYLGDLGEPEDYQNTLMHFEDTFPDTAGSFDGFVAQLPDAFDWRDHNAVTRSKDQGYARIKASLDGRKRENQGHCGGCWAFAAVAALESKILIAGGPEYNLSEQQLVSCNTENDGCCGGYINAATYWETHGPKLESCTDYADFNTRNCNCPTHCSSVSCNSMSHCEELSYRVENYYTVNVHSARNAKISIKEHGPGVFRYEVYDDFFKFWDNGTNGQVYVQSSPVWKDGHEVAIIGYSDTKGAWLCKNSWGDGGPNGDGTFWIAYAGHSNDLQFQMSNFSVSGVQPCEYSIYPSGQSFDSSAATGSIAVTATAGCDWTATDNAGWISITSGTSETGNGAVSYSVDANTGTSSRTGIITAAGKNFTITQSGISCSYSISPGSNSFGASGGTGSINVTATGGCQWNTNSNKTWISIVSGSSKIGDGVVNYLVAPNASNFRTGTITVAGKTFTVTQTGQSCSYSISPTSKSFSASGGTGSVSVIAPYGCTWTATESLDWVSITAGQSGNGNGTFSYSVSPNSDIAVRTGTITISGKIFTITQNGVTGKDRPVSGDYDGDGKADPAVWRENDTSGFPMLYIIPSSNTCPLGWDGPYAIWGGCGKQIGLTSDIPVSGDYDGDGKADPATWRKDDTSGFPMLYIIPSSSTCPSGWEGPYTGWGGCGKQIGLTSDIPVSGDYDGDGKADLAVWRENDISGFPMLYIIPSSSTCPSGWEGPYAGWGGCGKQVGLVGDIPVAGDFDGDGKADPATWRQNDSSGYPRIYIRPSSGNCPDSSWEGPYAGWGGCSKQLGIIGDIPISGDYDGDSKADPATWRKNDTSGFPMLYIRPSSGNCPSGWEGPYSGWGGCGKQIGSNQ